MTTRCRGDGEACVLSDPVRDREGRKRLSSSKPRAIITAPVRRPGLHRLLCVAPCITRYPVRAAKIAKGCSTTVSIPYASIYVAFRLWESPPGCWPGLLPHRTWLLHISGLMPGGAAYRKFRLPYNRVHHRTPQQYSGNPIYAGCYPLSRGPAENFCADPVCIVEVVAQRLHNGPGAAIYFPGSPWDEK